jgi:nitrogen fixation protein FixH
MKLHWGTGIVIAFLVFAAGILTMVTISMNREVDLVSDDYYQQELRHQDQIESTKRSNVLAEQPSIGVSNFAITLRLPSVYSASGTNGTLTFYRPADRKKDFVVPLRLDSSNTQIVRTASLQKGLWRVKVRWSQQNQTYYHEEPIMIQ